MKLALGTAQLGMSYGIANASGQPAQDEALRMVLAAAHCGIQWFDTAGAYGNSEEVLGACLPSWPAEQLPPQVATKITSLANCNTHYWAREAKQRLNVARLDAVLLHREDDVLLAGAPAFDSFLALRTDRVTTQLGVSCYKPERAAEALAAGMDCLQVPSNCFDRRFATFAAEAAERGVTVFVRSIFLQGLFFLPPDAPRVQSIPGAPETLRVWHDFCQRRAIEPAVLALAYGASLPGAIVLMGAENAAQVTQNAAYAAEAEKRLDEAERWCHECPPIPVEVTDPRRWGV